jgi:hypothetical protein
MVHACLASISVLFGTSMYIKKLFLPRLPDSIIDEVYTSIDHGADRAWIDKELNMYSWIPANNVIQEWCKENISPDLYWGVQVIDADLPMHKDHGTEIKFNYIIDQGGSDSVTSYYDDEGVLLDFYTMDPHAWYILNVAVNHGVTNIIPGRRRVSITSRVMP